MRDDAIFALMSAASINARKAAGVLERLEAAGLTIYKKKVFRNGRRPNKSDPLTPELARRIRRYFKANPDATQQEIANRFKVNNGRVSEALCQ